MGCHRVAAHRRRCFKLPVASGSKVDKQRYLSLIPFYLPSCASSHAAVGIRLFLAGTSIHGLGKYVMPSYLSMICGVSRRRSLPCSCECVELCRPQINSSLVELIKILKFNISSLSNCILGDLRFLQPPVGHSSPLLACQASSSQRYSFCESPHALLHYHVGIRLYVITQGRNDHVVLLRLNHDIVMLFTFILVPIVTKC